MKKIAIDCRLISWTGVGVYIQNLIRFSRKFLDGYDVYYLSNPTSSDLIKKLVNSEGAKIIPTNIKWHSVEEQTKLLRLLNSYNFDLVHFPYFSYPILYNKPFLVTIHDLTPMDFKTGVSTLNPLFYQIKYQGYRMVLTSAINRSSAIITPSKYVASQIRNRYKTDLKNKIFVTYEGIDNSLMTTKANDQLAKKYRQPFIVRLGNFYPHKNIERLIASFSEINKDVNLILAGPDDYFSKKIQELAQAVEHRESIIFHFNPSVNDRVFFYQNAICMVQPSLNEGFGLPVVESLYFNCPVLASKIPVFEELLGKDYKYFFDPYDFNSIRDTINKLLSHHKKRENKTINKKVLEEFSFENMAKKTAEIYKDILNK